jgi:hypothetical protein
MQTFITTKSWAITKSLKNGKIKFDPLIPEGSAIVVISQNENIVVFYHQGHGKTKISKEIFDSIPKIEKEFDKEFITDWVIPSKSYVETFNKISKIEKIFSTNKRIVKWISKICQDVKNTGGSSAIKGEQYLNFEPSKANWISGFTTKPFEWRENRSGRTTVVPTPERINEFENKTNLDLLPLGIKESDKCSYSEQEKLVRKLLCEFSGVQGLPENFKQEMSVLGFEISQTPHFDYMELDYHISLDDIDSNTHHGKEKGVEFCHFDPKGGTCASNVTLGLSKSNRAQSGNSVDEMGYKGVNAIRRKSGLKPLTKDEFFTKILQ